MRSSYTAQEVRDEWVARIVPDPACTKCKFSSYRKPRPKGYEPCYTRVCYVKICKACSLRRPYARAKDIPPDRLQTYLDQASDAFPIQQAIDELLTQS